MADINAIFEISEHPNTSKVHVDSNLFIVLKAIRDILVFIFLPIVLDVVIMEFILDQVDFMFKDQRRLFRSFLLFMLIVVYVQLSNFSHRISSFFYALVIFVLFFISTAFSERPLLVAELIILCVPFAFHYYKRSLNEQLAKAYTPTQFNTSDFTFLGDLENAVDATRYIEKTELNLDRNLYKKFKPLLEKKIITNNNDLVLKYSNNDELAFTIYMKDHKQVYVQHWKTNESTKQLNKSIYEGIVALSNIS